MNPTFDYFVGGAYTNEKLCEEVMTNCVGEHQQFDSLQECKLFYDVLPQYDQTCLERDNGIEYALQGNTTLCRFLHHFMMHSSPELHCYHVGRGDRPDAHGNFKCVPEDCVPPVVSEKEISDSNDCADHLQADIEMRLASAVPYCISALKSGQCRDDDEDERSCPRALRQFGLAGGTSTDKKRSLQAAKCQNKVRSGEASLLEKLHLVSNAINNPFARRSYAMSP